MCIPNEGNNVSHTMNGNTARRDDDGGDDDEGEEERERQTSQA